MSHYALFTPPRPGQGGGTDTESSISVPLVPRVGPRRLVRDLVALVRPHQWVKNVLAVGLPLLDVRQHVEAGLRRTAAAVVIFTLASCIVYIVNDVVDRQRDRAHPTKRFRPIAGERVPVPVAMAFAILLAGVLTTALAVAPQGWSWVVLGYLTLSVAYTFKLKHVPVLDVLVVATGFVLRVLLGYLAIDVSPSNWLVTAVFCGSLLLAIGKRRQELANVGAERRPALAGYTVQLADQLMLVSSVMTVCSLLLYVRTEAPLGHYAAWATTLTSVLGVFGLFRYLQVVLVFRRGEDPVRTLARDWSMVVMCLIGLSQLVVFMTLYRING